MMRAFNQTTTTLPTTANAGLRRDFDPERLSRAFASFRASAADLTDACQALAETSTTTADTMRGIARSISKAGHDMRRG